VDRYLASGSDSSVSYASSPTIVSELLLQGGRHHPRSAVYDRSTIYMGLLNFNLRSAYFNTEVERFVKITFLAEQRNSRIEIK